MCASRWKQSETETVLWKTNENMVSSGSHEYKTGINWLNYFSLLKIIVAYPSKVHSHLFFFFSLTLTSLFTQNKRAVIQIVFGFYFLFFRKFFFRWFISYGEHQRKNTIQKEIWKKKISSKNPFNKNNTNRLFISCQHILS